MEMLTGEGMQLEGDCDTVGVDTVTLFNGGCELVSFMITLSEDG